MLTQPSQVHKWFIKSKTEAYIQEKIGWSDQRNGSRIYRGGASYLRIGSITLNGRSTSSEVLWKYFGAKRRGLLKVKVFWRQRARVIKVIKISGMISLPFFGVFAFAIINVHREISRNINVSVIKMYKCT